MTSRRAFAATALALGAAAPLVGSPFLRRDATVDVDELARLIARGDDHVDALELAAWLKDRRSRLRVVDLRAKEQFDDDHIPTAENIAIEALAATPFRRDETIVLYSEGGAHAGQAWVLLRALGYEHVLFLRSGMFEWDEQVMNPALAIDATDREREAFERALVMTHYFGGTAQRDVPRAKLALTARERRRRGC